MKIEYIQCGDCLANYPNGTLHICDPLMKALVEMKNKEKCCLRCGAEKEQIKKEKLKCNVYGINYRKHLYK